MIAVTELRLPVAISNGSDQFGSSCLVAQLCAQNFSGRLLGCCYYCCHFVLVLLCRRK